MTLRLRSGVALGSGLVACLGACRALWGFDDLSSEPSTRPENEAAANEAPGEVGDVSREDPPLEARGRSCQGVRETGIAVDGTFAIDIDGPGGNPPFLVYCHAMNTAAPIEYLEVDASAPDANFSTFVRSAPAGVCPGPPVLTAHFSRVRLSLATMRIDPTDRRFARDDVDDPEAARWGLYGLAGSCVNGGDQSGRANVDLGGTRFRITADTVFVPQGYLPGGTSTFSPDRKRVDLTGGGYSGFNAVPPDAGIGVEFAK